VFFAREVELKGQYKAFEVIRHISWVAKKEILADLINPTLTLFPSVSL
jgi:hypothetical protein